MKFFKKHFSLFVFCACFCGINLFAGDDKPTSNPAPTSGPVQGLDQKALDQQAVDNSKKVSEQAVASEALALDLKNVIFDSILGQSFWDSKDQILALYLDNEIRAKYDLQEFDKLKLLIEWQKVAQSKLDIIHAKYENFFSGSKLQSVKLALLSKSFKFLFETPNISAKEFLSNQVVTQVVYDVFPELLFCELYDLLKVDFYDFWKEVYSKYKELIDQYHQNRENLTFLDQNFKNKLNTLLKFLAVQKNSLSKIKFVDGWDKLKKQIFGRFGGKVEGLSICKFSDLENKTNVDIQGGYFTTDRSIIEEHLKNSIKLFDVLILKLLKIKNELSGVSLVLDSLTNLSPVKKEIALKHIILSSDPDVKNGEFVPYFSQYKALIEEFLKKEKADESFSFRLNQCFYDLKKFRNQKEAKGSFYATGIFKDLEASRNCFLIDQMISNLESVSKAIKSGDGGLLGNGEFFEKLLSGDIKIPEKLKTVFQTVVQTIIGN